MYIYIYIYMCAEHPKKQKNSKIRSYRDSNPAAPSV